jgi:hypothetical protein
MNNDIHVLPLYDLKPHIEIGVDCPCRPTIEAIGANLLIIHNAWDNREVFEQAIEAMNE